MLNMLYNVIILELSYFFYHDHVTVRDSCHHDVTLNPNPK